MIFQAGDSGPGLKLAARTADVVFSVVQDMEEARQGYATPADVDRLAEAVARLDSEL